MFFKAFEVKKAIFQHGLHGVELSEFSKTEKRDDCEQEQQAKGRSRHRDEQPDQDPGHRRSPLSGHGEADSSHSTAKLCTMPSSLGSPPRWAICTVDMQRIAGCCSNEASLHRARSGSRRRGRSQGGASRAQKLSSARSASTRRRARLRRRGSLDSERAGARWLDDAQKLGRVADKAAKGR